MCTTGDLKYLFTWEIGRNAKGRRWFYRKLECLISQIPEEACERVGGSVYLVEQGYAGRFEELLSEFDGDDFSWRVFEVRI